MQLVSFNQIRIVRDIKRNNSLVFHLKFMYIFKFFLINIIHIKDIKDVLLFLI